jgi:hypothetical protein
MHRHETALNESSVFATGCAGLPRRLWLQLGPAVIGSPGGLGVGVLGLLGARVELSPLWSVAGTGMIPFVAQSVVEAQGSARVETFDFGIGVEGKWLRRSTWFCASGLGMARLWTVAKGRAAQAGYVTATDTTSTTAAQSPFVAACAWDLTGVFLASRGPLPGRGSAPDRLVAAVSCFLPALATSDD